MMKRYTKLAAMAAAIAIAALAGRATAETLGRTSAEISGANARTQETAAGNMVADALRAATKADAAMIPADALSSASIAAGSISSEDVRGLLKDPDDGVALLSLTGAQLKEALERGVKYYDRPFLGFPQVSGLTIKFDAGKAEGTRITEIKINGAALENGKRYKIATVDSLAGGSLGYFHIWTRGDVADNGKTVLDVVSAYIKAQGSVSATIEGRIAAK